MADWYPATLAALIPWHANFAAQTTATGTTHGLSAGQVTQIATDSEVVEGTVNYLSAVDAFHQAALAAGARDNGAPSLRPQYHANYYGAFVLDPDGYNIEAVCHRAE